MIFSFAKRMLTEVDSRLLWKFAYNFGLKGAVSVERYKSRLKRDIHFPPFLFISVINSCNLRCQGCWGRRVKPLFQNPQKWANA